MAFNNKHDLTFCTQSLSVNSLSYTYAGSCPLPQCCVCACAIRTLVNELWTTSWHVTGLPQAGAREIAIHASVNELSLYNTWKRALLVLTKHSKTPNTRTIHKYSARRPSLWPHYHVHDNGGEKKAQNLGLLGTVIILHDQRGSTLFVSMYISFA